MGSVVSSIMAPGLSAAGGVLNTTMGALGVGNQQSASANLVNPITKEQMDQAQANANTGLTNQQNFLSAVQAQNGLGNQSQVFNQLQGVANGTGPNPAQAQLAQATSANTANQAALMAGQRGAAANPALIARQAAMQGSANQQNAAGQAATLQAQQSLGALGQMGGIANQQANQQANATNAYSSSALENQNQLLNSQASLNNAKVGNQSNMNQVGMANQQARNQLIGNITGGAGAALGLAQGGEVKGPKSMAGQHLCAMAQGGSVPALVSPGEKYLTPSAVEQVKSGANPMQVGKTIPGKPAVGGAKNSYQNDTVPATLETGGVVLPRSVTKSKDADSKAEAFVAAVLARKGQGLKKPSKK